MKDLRFALMFDEQERKPFIMVDAGIITELIGKFKNKWEGGMMMVYDPNGTRFHLIAKFDDWKNYNQHALIKNPTNGISFELHKMDWNKMRKAVMDRDKRIKI